MVAAPLGSKWDGTAAAAVSTLEEVKEAKLAAQKLAKDTDKKAFIAFLFKLGQAIQVSQFAEDFLKYDGLDVVSHCLISLKGRQQTELLKIIRMLLVYENAIDQYVEERGMVGRIYNLLKCGSNTAKQVLDILIVTVGAIESGQKLVHEAATRVLKGELPYGPIVPLLGSQDLNVVTNVLAFLNVLIMRWKERDQATADEIVMMWKRCGLLKALQPLTDIEDSDIKAQLTVYQKLTGFIIPLGWYAATQFQERAIELRRRQQQALEKLETLRASQAKAAVVQGEVDRASETLKELTDFIAKKAAAGPSDGSSIEPEAWDEKLGAYAHTIFRTFTTADDIKDDMAKALSKVGTSAASWKNRNKKATGDGAFSDISSEDSEPVRRRPRMPRLPALDDSDDSSDERPPTDSDGESGGLPSEGDVNPPSDDEPLPDDEPAIETFVDQKTGDTIHQFVDPSTNLTMQVAVGPDGEARGPAVQVQQTADAAAASTHADAAPQPAADGTKQPPPPPRPFAPRPNLPKVAELKLNFYRGAVPKKKMRVMHWEKYGLTKDNLSMWHKVHPELGGELNCEFNYEEFETMFAQKERTERQHVVEKKEVVTLIDAKQFQNISIMMHKMPSIPEIQRAVQQLDSTVLDRDKLDSLISQVPTEEDEAAFKANADKKPLEEYEPPEQFFSMVVNSVAFTKRCKAWVLTFEWDELVGTALRPIKKVQAACDSILASKNLPYVMGIVLGFGNFMNEGHRQGNAPGFAVSTLSKLEMTKDVSGKMTLLQYVVQVVSKRNKEALELPRDLAPCLDGAQGIKNSDIEDGLKNVTNALRSFKANVKNVKDRLAAAGVSEDDDPFVPKMTAFFNKAEVEQKSVETQFQAVKDTLIKVLQYWSVKVMPNKTPDPDEFFCHLCPFLEKFQREAGSILKEKKRLEKEGKKLQAKKGAKGEDGMEALANQIKQDLVQS
ncbi:Formin-like protein 20 [Diplonema papillatum]|nr:Formin-like protein 20 [Diplonema papillatum]